MQDTPRVQINIKNAVAYVNLARPEKRNALDMAMFKAIDQAIKSIKMDRTIRAVIITGEGEDFCSGLDVKSMMQSTTGPFKLLKKLNPWRANLAQRVSCHWQTIGVPVIAVIQGRCWGGGLHIALGADFRIAEPAANFSIMEGRWGMIPDMSGLLALRQHCRIDVAKELTMTAEIIAAPAAQQAGLVSHVCEDPLALAQTMATTFSQQSPDAVAAVKKLYNKSWFSRKGTVLMRETFYQIKILLGKNQKIKVYNQTHDAEQHRPFLPRKKW